jgi:glycerol-3-phosphate acyltransferase PlsY
LESGQGYEGSLAVTSPRRSPLPWLLGAAALGYLLGTIPSADLAARLASRGTVNLRDAGTGNPGAANAASLLGPRWGAGVMAADIAKGFVACQAARLVAGEPGAYVAGTAAVVGHCYPVWSGFRGGKGVATQTV